MTLVIGVDEAGYGPNLGPLCIGLSAWEVRSEERGARGEGLSLFQLLKPVVCSKASKGRLAVADSKLLYKPGGGLEALELGVLGMLALLDGPEAQCWETLVDGLDADPAGARHEVPWHNKKLNTALPCDASVERLDTARSMLRSNLPDKVALRAMKARLVYPAEFNTESRRHGSKGRALSGWTLDLVARTLDELTSSSLAPRSSPLVHVTCDKHGGRNNYGGLLSEYFPDCTLRVIVESRPRSAYLLQRDGSEIRIEFRSKGESQLEAALASMTAKYLRELAMHAFNGYWQSHQPDLKPTAGYPMDAKRFKADIADKQRELSIDDDILWRER